MATLWQTQTKRGASSVGRQYNISGLNYDVAGVLYQGAYPATTWSFINKTS